jgi:hypothetical protein
MSSSRLCPDNIGCIITPAGTNRRRGKLDPLWGCRLLHSNRDRRYQFGVQYYRQVHRYVILTSRVSHDWGTDRRFTQIFGKLLISLQRTCRDRPGMRAIIDGYRGQKRRGNKVESRNRDRSTRIGRGVLLRRAASIKYSPLG